MITKIDPNIVETLKKLENVSDLALAINQKKPYTIIKIRMAYNIKFINNEDNT